MDEAHCPSTVRPRAGSATAGSAAQGGCSELLPLHSRACTVTTTITHMWAARPACWSGGLPHTQAGQPVHARTQACMPHCAVRPRPTCEPRLHRPIRVDQHRAALQHVLACSPGALDMLATSVSVNWTGAAQIAGDKCQHELDRGSAEGQHSATWICRGRAALFYDANFFLSTVRLISHAPICHAPAHTAQTAHAYTPTPTRPVHAHLSALLALPPAALPPDVAAWMGGRRGIGMEGEKAGRDRERRMTSRVGYTCAAENQLGTPSSPQAATAAPKLRVRKSQTAVRRVRLEMSAAGRPATAAGTITLQGKSCVEHMVGQAVVLALLPEVSAVLGPVLARLSNTGR